MNSGLLIIVHSKIFMYLRAVFGMALFVANGFLIGLCIDVACEAESVGKVLVVILFLIPLVAIQYVAFRVMNIKKNSTSYFVVAIRYLWNSLVRVFRGLLGELKSCLNAALGFVSTCLNPVNILNAFYFALSGIRHFTVRDSRTLVRKSLNCISQFAVFLFKAALRQVWYLLSNYKLKLLYLILVFGAMIVIAYVFSVNYLFYKITRPCIACRGLPEYATYPWFQVFVIMLAATFAGKSLKSATRILAVFWIAAPIGAILEFVKTDLATNHNGSYLLGNVFYQYLFALLLWCLPPALLVFGIAIIRTKRWAVYGIFWNAAK